MTEGKTTRFLSIDQVRGHLTPDLLGHTQRQLSKRDKEASYISDQRSFNSRYALATPREKIEIDLTKKHTSSKPPKFIHQPAGNNIHCAG